jgi:hypothetical protein
MTDITAIEQRDDAIVGALVAGRSVRAVQREFSLTITELDQALERCFPLDNAARVRTIRGDLSRLDRLIEKFYLKAIAGDGDVNSAALVVKAWERKAELLGLDAVQRIDLQIISPPEAPARHERIREAIMRLTEQPPVRRAAIERIDQLGPEKALEMLGSPQPRRLNGGSPNDGNGPLLDDDDAVAMLSNSGD